jgi:predicted transcriptional regulator
MRHKLCPNQVTLDQMIQENPDFVKKLPKVEQELCELYFTKKMCQKEISYLWGITQGAISSRLSRVKKRLEFMKELSNFDITNFDEMLSPFFDAFEIELLRTMMETTCQSETAHRLNNLFNLTEEPAFYSGLNPKYNAMTQVKVRHRFEKCLMKLKFCKHPYHELFLKIKQNLYMFHEVKLPHFDRRSG